MMPIPIVKALVQGKPPERRLFLPFIFSLAAKLEDIPLSTFVNNPTKIANNLVALYRRLNVDGVTCYYDLSIIAEALGCKVDWSTGSPQVERPDRDAALITLQQAAGGVKQRGRFPIALEVVHRLQGTLHNGPVLVVGLPGPMRVAQQLFGEEYLHELIEEDDEALDSFESLVEITISIAQAFCLAGTHLLYFDELDIPREFIPNWEDMMTALWKTVRFHGALPVLSTSQSIELLDWANAPVICKKPAMDEPEVPLEAPFALALSTLGVLTTDVSHLIQSGQCVLVVTDGEIPYQLEIQKLELLMTAMRSLLAS